MQISRRDALMGATAAAVVTGAIAGPLAIKAAGVKAAMAGDPVIDLAQQLSAASDAWFAAIDVYEEAYHRVGYNWAYWDRGSVEVETSNGCYGWGAGEIRQAAEDGRITPARRDAALAEIERRQCEGQELGIEPQYQERERRKARFWDLQERLLDTPATTTRGVLAKLRGYYHDGEIAGIDDGLEDLPGEYATSIYRDLERLAGEARPT